MKAPHLVIITRWWSSVDPETGCRRNISETRRSVPLPVARARDVALTLAAVAMSNTCEFEVQRPDGTTLYEVGACSHGVGRLREWLGATLWHPCEQCEWFAQHRAGIREMEAGR